MRTGTIIGGVLFLLHAGVVVGSLAGPMWLLAGTFFPDGEWTLDVWRNVFGDLGRWGELLRTTGVVVGTAVLVSMGAGVVLAVLLFKTDALFRRPAGAIVLAAATVPLYVVTTTLLSVVGLENVLRSRWTVGWIHAVAHLPIVVLVIGAALRSVRADLEEAAMIDGAGPLRVLSTVTLRLGVGGVVAAFVLVVLWVSTDYTVSDVLVVRTFAEEAYTQFAVERRPFEPALVCLPQIVLFGGLLWALRRGFLTGDAAPLSAGGTRRFAMGPWRGPVGVVAAGACAILIALPIMELAPRLIGLSDLAGRARIFLGGEVFTSAWTSAVAAVTCGFLGVGLAWYVVRRRRWRPVVAGYVVLMLAFPAPLVGIGLIELFNRPGLLGAIYDRPWILVVAYTVRFLPIAVVLLVPAIRAIPVECELAAKVDGAGTFDTWRRIILPLCGPTMLVAMFVVAVLSFGELPCSYLLRPPGCETAGVRFFSLIHYGLYPDVALLTLLSMGVIVVPWLGLLVLLRKRLMA